MNEQQPYEKNLAEKLQQLPLPDIERNWQQMKSRLDKEMPRGAGYWRWITGIGIVVILLTGSWYISSRKIDTNPNLAVNKASDSTRYGTSSVDSQKGNLVLSKQKDVPLISPHSSTQSTDQHSNDITKTEKNDENLHNKLSVVPPLMSKTLTNQTKKGLVSKGSKDNSGNSKGSSVTGQIQKQAPAGYPHPLAQEVSAKNSTPRYNTQNTIFDFEVTKLVGDSMELQDHSNIFPENNLKGQQPLTRVKSKKVYADENRSLAVGFSLPLGFPLGDQKPGAYNVNAGPNIISDFIPVPHLQYHVNNKVYLQTEIQLMNPQYIQSVLLYQQKTEIPATNTIHYNSIYAKKLYYFNIPVGIHYSPFQHFYLGTGLQFSSLVSGVAMNEETSSVIGSGRYTLLNQQHTKFKNDSISNRIDNSEFRLMLDANYYWKQFTVGLRYNQALSNYVRFRLNPAAPLFQDKNKSLQFYLRYNLWEDHKRIKK